MKICFVHEEYPKETNFGGIATYQKLMAEYFANHGDSVTVIARGKKDEHYFENNVQIYRIGATNNNNSIQSVKTYRRKVSKLLLHLQNLDLIDIIETPDWGANTIYFEKYRKVPLIVRLHTPLKIWLKYNNNEFGKAKDLILKWENKMLNKADMLISCSELLKENVIKNYNLNKEIFVLPNPYNSKEFYNLNNNENSNIIFVGSLEERKGAINFAKALNKVLQENKKVQVIIVGKDTNRNNKNISTKQYMLSIINKVFYERIHFVGMVDNAKINEYLNNAKLAVLPSIFDNFPYAVLEAMSVGKYIACSDNMGITSLVQKNNKNCIFKYDSHIDLADKICNFLKSKTPYLDYKNIEIVQKYCNQKLICKKMKQYYEKAIKIYKKNLQEINLYTKILKQVGINDKILKIEKLKYNLANDVKKIYTEKNIYMVKKYNYKYDFDLCNILYELYSKNNFNVVKPINPNPIVIKNKSYNIFHYIKHSKKCVQNDFLVQLIQCNRKINLPANLNEKCDSYYKYLSNLKTFKLPEEQEIINLYLQISKNHLFAHSYINHGDLSKSNILFYQHNYYIIDFDETTITTELYDFANIVVKHKVKGNKFQINEIRNIIQSIFNDLYTYNDYVLAIKYYLCKILLEKFYLFELDKIDLFDQFQSKDSYKKYLKLLKETDKI